MKDQQALELLHSEFEMQVYLCITFISILISSLMICHQKGKDSRNSVVFFA